MGNCCFSSSQGAQTNGRQIHIHCPQTTDQESIPSRLGPLGPTSPGVFVNTNLETSIQELPRVSPASAADNEVLETLVEPISVGMFPRKRKDDCELHPIEVIGDEFGKLNEQTEALDEPDDCPICLEEYDLENPKLFTNCEHHFHLSCILEWMERSNSCPICHQVLSLEEEV